MSRVKIEDLKPPAKDLNVKEMKKLYGGSNLVIASLPILGILNDLISQTSSPTQSIAGSTSNAQSLAGMTSCNTFVTPRCPPKIS